MIRHLPAAQSGAPIPRASDNDGFMDVRLATSRNGVNWTFAPGGRDAFLPRGVGVRDVRSGLYNGSGSDLDAGFVYAANGGLLDPDMAMATSNNNNNHDATTSQSPPTSPWVWILYWGGQSTHAGGGAFMYTQPDAFAGLFRARIRREGWTALASPRGDAAATGSGWAATVPLRLPIHATKTSSLSHQPTNGASVSATAKDSTQAAAPILVLRVNAEVDAAGNITVAIINATTMQPLPGYSSAACMPLRGNSLRQTVVWGGDRSTWEGGSAALPAVDDPVILNFSMVHARIFALEFVWLPTVR